MEISDPHYHEQQIRMFAEPGGNINRMSPPGDAESVTTIMCEVLTNTEVGNNAGRVQTRDGIYRYKSSNNWYTYHTRRFFCMQLSLAGRCCLHIILLLRAVMLTSRRPRMCRLAKWCCGPCQIEQAHPDPGKLTEIARMAITTRSGVGRGPERRARAAHGQKCIATLEKQELAMFM
jgi:hypothetical protein